MKDESKTIQENGTDNPEKRRGRSRILDFRKYVKPQVPYGFPLDVRYIGEYFDDFK